AAGLYTERDPAVVQKMLGWKNPAHALVPCLAFPFRHADGTVNGYVRFKPDNPRLKDGKPAKYESQRGSSNRAFLPPGTVDVLSDVTVPLIVTEGEKKSLAADQHGFACIGLVGVYGWQQKRETKGDPRNLIADLAAIPWNGRTVYLVFDSDAADNP